MFPKGKPRAHCDTCRGLCESHGFLSFFLFFIKWKIKLQLFGESRMKAATRVSDRDFVL